jgi:ATP/ADP translocase
MTYQTQVDNRARLIAIAGAMLLMAHMISGKAARDSLFLLNFPVEFLPRITGVAAALSLVFVVVWSRGLSTRSPARLVPMALIAGGTMHLMVWGIYLVAPKVSAVIFYLYMIGPNAILLSSYWSLLNERFDPQQAKRMFGQITAGGTLGGLLSGFAADQVADLFGPASLLPLLAILQVAAFVVIRQLCTPSMMAKRSGSTASPDWMSGFRNLRNNQYLRNLAGMVFLVTLSAGLLDYVFKSSVTETLGRGETLVTFFALFYAFHGLATFLMQSFVAPRVFERFGVTNSLSALPVAYFAGVLSFFAVPGIAGLVLLRGLETTTRGSIYRSGYEVCFTPVSVRQKRASKTIIDVGVDRFGELVAALLLQAILIAGLAQPQYWILAGGCALSIGVVLLIRRLGRLYLHALKTSLVAQSKEKGVVSQAPLEFDGDTMVLRLTVPQEPESALEEGQASPALPVVQAPTPAVEKEWRAPAPGLSGELASDVSEDLQQVADLRSGDPKKIEAILSEPGQLSAIAVPAVIDLLARDRVASQAMWALRKCPLPIEGQLADALLDESRDFVIRRRVPRVLKGRPGKLSVLALLEGMNDTRFEVRYRCGLALTIIRDQDPDLHIPEDRILKAIERECGLGRKVWDGLRLLDRTNPTEQTFRLDKALKGRSTRMLEHVFNLLSLLFPKEPLQLAYSGLHSDDSHLRGTALEYLENVLPATVRDRILALLQEASPVATRPAGPSRPTEAIVEDLRRSNPSLFIALPKVAATDTDDPVAADAWTGSKPDGQ